MKCILLKMINKKLFPLIESIPYPAINYSEFELIISSIKNIRGYKSKTRDFIKDLLIKDFLSQEKLGEFDIYIFKNKNIDIYDLASTRSRKSFFSFHTALSIPMIQNPSYCIFST